MFAAGLKFEGVSHRYGSSRSLSDVSFSASPGEIVCVLGASGCGKTTLLRLAAGLERASSGRILINGGEVCSDGVFVPPEERNVGMIFQDCALFPHLRVRDNVAFGLSRLPRRSAVAAARAALTRVGLERYVDSWPHELSGGEQQRAALARSIAPRPSILLMDEPFSGLDRGLREGMRDETLSLLKETRASCVLVTHDPEEAMWMADRIVFLREGRVVQDAPPLDLYNRPTDIGVARYFSALNEFRSRVVGGSADTPVGCFPAPHLSEGSEALVAVRPQGLLPLRGGEREGVGRNGLVTASRFLGSSHLISALFEGLDRPALSRPPVRLEIAAGDVLPFEVATEHVFIFGA